MANFDGNYNFYTKRRPFALNRSVTMHEDPVEKPHQNRNKPSSVDRVGSLKGMYSSTSNSIKGKVKRLCSFFEPTKPSSHDEARALARVPSKLKPTKSVESRHNSAPTIRLPGTEGRIVVYFTSLRGIRRTFEDCYAVRTIFRGFRVRVDERDVSMDSAYRRELQGVLGDKNVSLPQVFIGGRYVGGADVIKQHYEVGELAKILERYPKRAPGFVCQSCGDARFMPCGNCSGSRKVFDEDEGVPKRCWVCNENGLVRCPSCCD